MDSQPNRIQILLAAHPWISEEQARLILCDRYRCFSETYASIGCDIQALLDNFVWIASKLSESDLRDRLAIAEEWIGVQHGQRDWTLPKNR